MIEKKIFIVDDHSILRQGVSQFINNEKDLVVVGEAEDADGAIQGIIETAPDLAIVDISLKGVNGLELTTAIKHRFNIPVLILSMHDETLYAERAIKAGANGYIMKNVLMADVIEAIREIFTGDIYLNSELKNRLLTRLLSARSEKEVPSVNRLTNRELDVFRFIGQGQSTKQIASHLGLSKKTIETYKERIKKKLNLLNSTELIQYAIKWKGEE